MPYEPEQVISDILNYPEMQQFGMTLEDEEVLVIRKELIKLQSGPVLSDKVDPLAGVDRFSFHWANPKFADMRPDPEGEWVRYSDVKAQLEASK